MPFDPRRIFKKIRHHFLHLWIYFMQKFRKNKYCKGILRKTCNRRMKKRTNEQIFPSKHNSWKRNVLENSFQNIKCRTPQISIGQFQFSNNIPVPVVRQDRYFKTLYYTKRQLIKNFVSALAVLSLLTVLSNPNAHAITVWNIRNLANWFLLRKNKK